MAIENLIILNEALAPENLVNLLTVELGFTRTFDELSKKWIALSNGIGVWVRPTTDLEKKVLNDRFRVSNATLSIWCRIDKFEYLSEGQQTQVALFVFILKWFQGDLVVLENGDKPLIVRKSGALYVDLGDAFWRRKLAPELASSGISFVEKDLDRPVLIF